LAVLMLVPGACSDSMGHHGSEELRSAIVAADAETAHHARACLAADSMGAAMDELGRHERSFDQMTERMEGAMNRMSHCSASTKHHMLGSLFGVRTSMPGHRARLERAASLDAMHFECSTHATAMAHLFQAMDDELDRESCMGM
jgi:hypothetical protein